MVALAVVLALSGVVSIAPQSSHADSAPSSINGVGDVTPAVAFETLDASHTFTFTCDNAAGAVALTVAAGCYDISSVVANVANGPPTFLTSFTCGDGLPTTPVSSFTASCGSLTNGKTFTASISPHAAYAYGFLVSGFVPAICPSGGCSSADDTTGSCPAGTSGPDDLYGIGAVCQFFLFARAYFVQIDQLAVSGSSCGGQLTYSAPYFFGTPCTVTATGTGEVTVKTGVADCTAAVQQPVPPEFGTGATYACSNGVLSITNIAMPNLQIALFGNVVSTDSTGVQWNGPLCSSTAPGSTVNTTTGTPIAFCPVAPGTAQLQASLTTVTGGSQPSVTSAPFTFVYSCSTSSCVGPYVGTIQSTLTAAGFGPGTPTGKSLTQQLNAVQTDIAAGNTAQALLDLSTFACHVQAQSGKAIPTGTAATLVRESRILYVGISGGQPLPAC